MFMKGPKMRDEFERFSVEDFMKEHSEDAGNVELLAQVLDDGDYVVLRPVDREGSTVYKLPKQVVVIHDAEPDSSTNWRRITVPRTAACLRLTAATASAF